MDEQLVRVFPKDKPPKERSYRPWRVRFDLAYDGGGSEFDVYYRYRFTALMGIIWHKNFESWGGTAKLYYRGL